MLSEKILVPHDRSKPADNALDHAVKLTSSVDFASVVILFTGYNYQNNMIDV